MEITTLEKSRFSHFDVLELIHSSFLQWEEKGIKSSVLEMTVDNFKERTKDSTIFVAIDDDGQLIGTTTCSIMADDNGEQFAYNLYSAVSNQTKKSGVGSKLLGAEKQFALNNKCKYIISDTSSSAKWSAKWHMKNGFKKVEYSSFWYNDYYSYVFRYQLDTPSVWNSTLYTNLRFWYSFVKTRAMIRPDGEYTSFGKFVTRIL